MSDIIKVLGQRINVAGASDDDKQFIYYDNSVAANTTFTAVIGMCLGQKDVVKTYASATNMSFTLFGVETK